MIENEYALGRPGLICVFISRNLQFSTCQKGFVLIAKVTIIETFDGVWACYDERRHATTFRFNFSIF
jgi:hypothetical protein